MKRGSRKAQIVSLAAKIFAEEGYTETTIDRISNEMGITGPALYRHFSSKQEILDIICIGGIEQALETAREIEKETDLTAEEKLRKLIKIRLDYLFGSMRPSYLLAVSQKAHLSPAAREQTSAMQKEFRDMCARLLREIKPNMKDSDVTVAFFAVQSMNIYTAWRYRDRGMLSPEELKALLEKMDMNTLLA